MPLPKRKELLINGEVYHLFNRSVASEEIFAKQRELKRTIQLLDYYRYQQKFSYSYFKVLPEIARCEYRKLYKKQKPLVEIFAYAIMPNHFHILAQQKSDLGIKKFLSNFQNSYARYYNTKNERKGSLFLKPFKSKRIPNDDILLHTSRYIHLNPVTSYLVEYKDHYLYPWTSFLDYLGEREKNFVDTEFILKIIGSIKAYSKFVADQSDYQRSLSKIKNLLND